MYKILSIILWFLILFSPYIYPQFSGQSTAWASMQGTDRQYWIGDFNGDGLDDKLQLAGDNNWWVALSNGKGFGGESNWTTTQDSGANKYFVGDFNGDGMTDIISYRSATGIWKVSLAYQDLSQTTASYKFKAPVLWNGQNTDLFAGLTNLKVGDFDGDGITDLMVYYSGWYVARSNGLSFDSPVYRGGSYPPGGFQSSDKIYIADVDGDGMEDIIIYKYSDPTRPGIYNHWYVSKSSGNSNFPAFSHWSDGQGNGSGGVFFKDVNGDGLSDKINFYSDPGSQTGEWWVAMSNGNSFGGESFCWWRAGLGAIGGFAGDFDGDRLCDAMYSTTSNQWWAGINTSSRPTPNHEKIVATWFNGFYLEGHDLYNNKRDTLKLPVAGWGSGDSTYTGSYNSRNKDILNKQINAMIKAGVNLIVFDITNGWRYDDGALMSAIEYETIDSLFYVMKYRKDHNQSWVKIAIGLGYEFWGKREINGYYDYYTNNNIPMHSNEWNWDSWGSNDLERWHHQYNRQRSALDEIKSKYSGQNSQYDSIYFNYLGYPLVVAFIDGGQDYPPRYELSNKVPGDNIPLWHYNDFTVITANHWNFTTGYKQGSDAENIFIDGRDQKRYWGWGESHINLPQPYNKECMAVLPGTETYWRVDPSSISRDNGNYYIDSWKRVIEVNSNIMVIGGWNNWPEETAIEGCVDRYTSYPGHGWRDLNGVPTYDWYLQITKTYASIFKNGTLLSNTFLQIDGFSPVYQWTGSSFIQYSSTYKPHNKPIIKLPLDWLQNHGYGVRFPKTMPNNEVAELPSEYSIGQNYPNPFNPTTNISYSLPQTSIVTIKVYDILGSVVKTLVDRAMDPGSYTESFDGSKFASGIYFVRLIAQPKTGMPFVKTIKMVMTK